MGAHQKFDRVARRNLALLLPETPFPPIKLILHFEGKNGPDGVKRKSPAQDEPWHYYNPKSNDPQPLLGIIDEHYQNLVSELRNANLERSAFEAAWLAHAIVDGLTPAHHFPYEEELSKLRGEGMETRTTVKEKIVITGDTTIDTLAKNWKVWGAKGLMTAHYQFEWGVAAIIKPMRLKRAMPTEEDIAAFRRDGLVKAFEQYAKEIDELNFYGRFIRLGWTKKLAKQVRTELAPRIGRIVTLAWYMAVMEAKKS